MPNLYLYRTLAAICAGLGLGTALLYLINSEPANSLAAAAIAFLFLKLAGGNDA